MKTKKELQSLSLLEFARLFFPKDFEELSNWHKQLLEEFDKRSNNIKKIIEAHRQGHIP